MLFFPSAVYCKKSVRITNGQLCQNLMMKVWKISQPQKQKYFAYNIVKHLSPKLLTSYYQGSS